MRLPTLDPRAAERARAMRLHPEVAQNVTDPTDRRFGELALQTGERPAPARGIVDPTDPECGRRRLD